LKPVRGGGGGVCQWSDWWRSDKKAKIADSDG
jgi:hypothetical protein